MCILGSVSPAFLNEKPRTREWRGLNSQRSSDGRATKYWLCMKSTAGIQREPDAKGLLPCRTFSSLQIARNSSSGRVLSRKGLEFTNLYRSPRASLRYFLHDVKSPFLGRGALIPDSI